MARNIRERFPTSVHFTQAYRPQWQLSALSNPLRYILNDAPQIRDLEQAYKTAGAKTWMMAHLSPIFGVSDVDTDSIRLLNEAVDILFERFYFEKCTAFILFCAKCRAREYKIAFGVVKLDAILEAGNDFLKNELPTLKDKAGIERQKKERDGDIIERNGWKHCTQQSNFFAWRDSTLRLLNEKGPLALVDSINNDDEYHLGISAMIGIGALDVENGKVVFREEVFYNYIKTLKPCISRV